MCRHNLDDALHRLEGRRADWAAMGLEERVSLLSGLLEDLAPLFDEWVAIGLQAKRAAGDPYAAGWEWSGGPLVVVRVLGGLGRTLSGLKGGRLPFLPGPLEEGPGGRLRVRSYPTIFYERVATPGTTAEVWFRPSVGPHDLAAAQAALAEPARGRTALVLGGGNVSGLQVADALTKLFVERAVVILKVSPVTGYLMPLLRAGLRRLVEPGWLELVEGGPEEGAYLCAHPLVDAIHMTGSDRTYEAVLFGGGEDGAARKARREPVLSKPVTAELGNIAPAIVVPGPWTDRDIAYQAEHLVSHLCDSGSFSCSRTRVIVQHAGWPGRVKLLDAMRRVLKSVPTRNAYYPGSRDLHARFLEAHPEAERFGSGEDGHLPWALIPGLAPAARGEMCFSTESFCPVITETAIEAGHAAEFLDRACDFANERLWGTLTASILVRPDSLRDGRVAEALERTVERLRYGTVALNCLPGMAYAIGTVPWGSYPGNEPWDIQSGTGFANNAYLLQGVEKVVLRAPFRCFPMPIWFPSRRRAFGRVTRLATRYEANPTALGLAALMVAALR